MKTIVRQESNTSLFIYEDDVVVNIAADKTTIGNPAINYILDCNSSNAALYENVTPPEDWVARKYLFDGAEWKLNPSYIQPPVRNTQE